MLRGYVARGWIVPWNTKMKWRCTRCSTDNAQRRCVQCKKSDMLLRIQWGSR